MKSFKKTFNFVVGLVETIVGLIPAGGGISRVVQATSRSRSLEILINSSELDIYKLLNDGLVNEICSREDLSSVLTSYVNKLSESESKATEILMQNIDKFKELNLEKSFLFEEELLNKLSDEQ